MQFTIQYRFGMTFLNLAMTGTMMWPSDIDISLSLCKYALILEKSPGIYSQV